MKRSDENKVWDRLKIRFRDCNDLACSIDAGKESRGGCAIWSNKIRLIRATLYTQHFHLKS
jgi:hypothetical protein